MKRIFFVVFISFSYTILAQNTDSPIISKQLIGPAGNNFQNGELKSDFSTGDLLVGLMNTGDASVQIGNGYFPSLDLEALNIENTDISIIAKIFPNPVAELLFISHPNENIFNIKIEDLSGKLLFKGQAKKGNPINMAYYPSGIYLISITDSQNKKTNIYKIIKR